MSTSKAKDYKNKFGIATDKHPPLLLIGLTSSETPYSMTFCLTIQVIFCSFLKIKTGEEENHLKVN